MRGSGSDMMRIYKAPKPRVLRAENLRHHRMIAIQIQLPPAERPCLFADRLDLLDAEPRLNSLEHHSFTCPSDSIGTALVWVSRSTTYVTVRNFDESSRSAMYSISSCWTSGSRCSILDRRLPPLLLGDRLDGRAIPAAQIPMSPTWFAPK
jgi:hypothetical protein